MGDTQRTEGNKKIKQSIVDKVLFILLAVAAVIIFIWDIIKDFIPEEYWQLKLLVMIVGALSGFFTVMSFLWDKKFSNVAKDITSAHDEKINSLSNQIAVFLKEETKYYDSFNEAIMPIIASKSEFEEVKIFAYSAKNYIDYLLRSSVRINHLQLCLRRANDHSAWFVRDEGRVQKYKNELEKVLEGLESLKEKRQVLSYAVRFYDFESYSHFGIFDDRILLGELIPLFTENKTVQIGKIQTMENIGRNANLFANKTTFFDNLFKSSVADSGLKLLHSECRNCYISKTLQDPRYITGSDPKLKKCDISLISNTETIQDFLLIPDFHPISELHMLLVCKFHILNLYDYLNHQDTVKDLETLIYSISKIVFKKTGRKILIFEHGSATDNSELSASSMKHLSLHIIYAPLNYEYIDAIHEDNKSKSKPLLDTSHGGLQFTGLQEFAQEGKLRNKDYLMIWEPGENTSQGKIYAWLAINQELQYLRRIFFQGLSPEEKLNLYGEALDGQFDDEYNWEIHEFDYSDERLKLHKEIGEAIHHGYKRN